MGNIYTVGPNEALVVSGMYIITLFSFCEVKLQLIYKVFWIPLHSKSRLAFSRCQLSASYFFRLNPAGNYMLKLTIEIPDKV